MGRMPGLGLVEKESELDEIELWPGSEEWEWLENEEGGPGPPSAVCSEFPLSSFCYTCFLSGDVG